MYLLFLYSDVKLSPDRQMFGGFCLTKFGKNTTDITGCYIPANELMNDTTGVSVFIKSCFYDE